jgi:diguanylate cyclase (GGDEF)-like protein/PAS domain S-box-containing protein
LHDRDTKTHDAIQEFYTLTGPTDIAHWRSQIFQRLLLIVALLGTIVAVPSVALAIKEQLWVVAVIDVIAVAWLLALWRVQGVRHEIRVFQFLLIAFVVGLGLLLKERPVSQIYLSAVPVLAALLLGRRPALWWLAASSLAILLFTFLPGASTLSANALLSSLVKPVVIALNFAFITGIITFSCSTLLLHLTSSLERVRATAAVMEQGRNELRDVNRELRLTVAAVARLSDMVLIARVGAQDVDGQQIVFVNDAFERRSGYRRDEVVGRSLRMLAGPDTSGVTLARITDAMARWEPVRAELLNYTKGGEAYWVETDMVPFADESGTKTHWVVVERDITDRRKSEDDIHRLAFYDVLTALPNRRLLMDRVDKLLDTATRDGNFSAVVFIDLDHFKDINDARGHAVGDALLRSAAERLTGLIRKGDTVARIGGDEFVVLLPQLGLNMFDAAHRALSIAEKVRLVMANAFEIEGQSYQSSASLGVTLFPTTGQTAHDVLREADTAMYRAKADGRNGIVFFEDAMQADVEQRLTMGRELALAVEDGQLQMYYQPQVDQAGYVVGAELLMRWCKPEGGMVPPDVFIPVAEQTGLIHRMGHWAMREACDAVVKLAAAGHPIPLSVNVSPSQFRQADFVERVRQTLADSGAAPHWLILEVTEGLLIEKFDETVERMHQLAAMGLRFSIDDFGTGYSSLAYLRKMPLYELKIDRSFIDGTPADENGKAIVQSILAMAQHLGLRVVAEGVENRAQADFLTTNGCDSMQGYFFARPAPYAQLLPTLRAALAQPGAMAGIP